MAGQYSGQSGWNDFDKIQAGYVSWIDEQVGDLIATLDDPNGDGDISDSVLENTLIVFTSDNGGWENGGHNWDRNSETVNGQNINLRGSKEGPYEGGLRTPMIAYWKGTIAGGTTSDVVTTFADYLPNFADLAGAGTAAPGDLDGLSLAKTLTGQGVQETHDSIYFEDYSYNDNGSVEQVLRSGDFKLIRKHGGALELYNLATDPGEQNNIANTQTAIRDQLTVMLDANHTPQTAQFGVLAPKQGTGNSRQDGIMPHGIRELNEGEVRDWSITEIGDASSLSGVLNDTGGDKVVLHLDDLHQEYRLELDIDRLGNQSPQLLAQLLGESGFVYYSGTLDTLTLNGNENHVSLDMMISQLSPTSAQITGDLGGDWKLSISHQGGNGQFNISGSSLSTVASVSVPEPTSSGLLFVVAGAFLRRPCRRV